MKKRIFSVTILFVLCYFFGYGFYSFYTYKINRVELFQYQSDSVIALEDNNLSFVFLIDKFDTFEKNILKLGDLFQLAYALKIKFYFVTKKQDVKKLEQLFDEYDITEAIYLTNRLNFWAYSQGNEPTLLVFNRSRLIHSVYGCKDWNTKEAIENLYKTLKGRKRMND